jgi:tetratricopeptide (TPR) repeat protein
MRFRAPRRLPASAALVAALLIALPGLANAADEADANNQPVEEQGASKEAGASEETRPCFTGKGSVKEVLDSCDEIIAKGSRDTQELIRAHSVRAMAYSALGRIDDAIVEMDKVVALNPERANSYFMRAAGYDAKKEYDKALADLDKAISMNDKDADYYLLRGIVYGHKGELDKGIADVDRKIELDPKATPFRRARPLPAEEDYDKPSPTTAR